VCRAVIPGLLALGASRVKVHDPSAFAREEVKKDFPPDDKLTYHDTIAETIKGSGACIILTEWDEYKRLKPPDFADHGWQAGASWIAVESWIGKLSKKAGSSSSSSGNLTAGISSRESGDKNSSRF